MLRRVPSKTEIVVTAVCQTFFIEISAVLALFYFFILNLLKYIEDAAQF